MIWLNSDKIIATIIPDRETYSEIKDCGPFLSIFRGEGGDMAGHVYMTSFEVIALYQGLYERAPFGPSDKVILKIFS
jgi:hypothetical protein